jgi:hypothetical protein
MTPLILERFMHRFRQNIMLRIQMPSSRDLRVLRLHRLMPCPLHPLQAKRVAMIMFNLLKLSLRPQIKQSP